MIFEVFILQKWAKLFAQYGRIIRSHQYIQRDVPKSCYGNFRGLSVSTVWVYLNPIPME